jgi:hypothetical protein
VRAAVRACNHLYKVATNNQSVMQAFVHAILLESILPSIPASVGTSERSHVCVHAIGCVLNGKGVRENVLFRTSVLLSTILAGFNGGCVNECLRSNVGA